MHDGHGCWTLQEAFAVGLRAERTAEGSRKNKQTKKKICENPATAREAPTLEVVRTRLAGGQVFTFSPSFCGCFSLLLWGRDVTSRSKAVGGAGLGRSLSRFSCQ